MWCVAGTAGGGGGEGRYQSPSSPSCGLYLLPGCSDSLSAHSRQEKRPKLTSAAEATAKMSRGMCDCSPGWGQQRGSSPWALLSQCWFWFWGANVLSCADGPVGQRLRWPWGVQTYPGSSGLAFADLSHHAHQHGARQAGHYSSTILPLPLTLALEVCSLTRAL